jgi:beta-phosphoglucomutase-like phosphatase (HAD superfamily)
VVGADEVSEGKPAPDLYLAASERLGVSPGESVAVEDSPSGVAAARAAGLYVIGIPSLADMKLEADMTADSLDDTAVREKLGVAHPTLRQRRPWPGQHRP